MRFRIKRITATALITVSNLAPLLAHQLALGQVIVPDGTLPTTVNLDEATNQFTVTGGSAVDGNLFHSFEIFSPADSAVLFDLRGESFGNEIERIFSRVTGSNTSEINGSLGILGGNSPDLFLLNPNGIVFGPDARLNLAGSFIGTTANSIEFSDGGRFSALPPQTDSPLLSISVPVGLQLGQNPGEISVLGPGRNILRPTPFSPPLQDPTFPVQGLSIDPGNTLALIGGDITFQGGEIQPQYRPTPNGQNIPQGGIQVELGAVANGSVKFESGPFGWKADYSDVQIYGNISLSDNAWVNVGGLFPSNVSLSGQDITFSSSSLSNLNFGEQVSGQTTLNAANRLQLQGNGPSLSDISEIQVATLGAGQGGNLNVFAQQMNLFDGAYVTNASYGAGDAGALTIDVVKGLQLNGFSGIAPASPQLTLIAGVTFASGQGGDLDIRAETIHVENGGVITATSIGEGLGGSLRIEAEQSLVIRGIHPLSIADSNISTANFGSTDATQVTSIQTPRLEVLEGATLSADAYGTGDASGVLVNASQSVRVGGFSSVPRSAAGEITSGARPSLFAEPNQFLPDTEISSLGDFTAQSLPTGDSGNITINTPSLELFDGGEVATANNGTGDAGDIRINTENLALLDQAKITAETEAGAGGNIDLRATDSVLLRNGSQILASSGGAQNGGNITIQSPQLVALPQENSDISANSKGSQGGRISITASSVLGLREREQLTNQSDITALSELEDPQFSGTIELTQPNTGPASGIATLPIRLSSQEQTPIANACIDPDAQLTRRGRGGLPLGPNNLLHDTLLVDGDNDLINQAIALRNQGFYSKALTILSQEVISFNKNVNPSIKDVDRPADLARQAIALRQLGITHKLLEQHEASQAALEESLAIAQRLNDPEQTSATLLSLGNFERAEHKVQQARQHYQQALDENPSHTLKHQILANQLALEVATGHNDVAKRIAKALLDELAGDISDPLHLRTRLNVAATLLKYQQLDVIPDFLTFLYQDLEGARIANDPTAIAYALGHLGQDYEQTGQWEKTQEFSEAALKYAQRNQDPFQEYQWAWQLGRITRARWEASGDERWRSQAKAAYKISLQALQQLRGDLATISPALQFSFRTRVEPVYREYVSLLLASDDLQTQPSSANLSQALDTMEALRLAELDNFFQDSCLETAPQAIQKLDPTAAVIYPIILDDRIEVVVSHQGKLQRHNVSIRAEQLEQTIETFQKQLLVRSRNHHQKLGQQLYDWLIHPAYSQLQEANIETLVIVPDGALKNIPIAALFDGKQYLIERFNMAIAPSLQLLPAKSASAIPPSAIVAGISKEHQGFAQLPYVEQEIEGVQSLFPGNRLMNESFTHDQLEQSLVEAQAPIVHIATHGQFSSSSDETFILAWDEKITIDQLRELLQRRDRRRLTPTELLVLSACETAVGDETAALGLAGVAVRAGARSTLASLWSVNDQSTALMMQTFYQQLAEPASNRAEALRQAQLAMLQHPEFRHPYYWSAFVLMGSWQ